MSPAQIPQKTSSALFRCEERSRLIDHRKNLTPGQETDAAIKGTIERALWNDDVLRAIESYEIEVHVKARVVYLDGYIASSTSQRRIQNIIQVMHGLLGIQNNLILDDQLTHQVAASLGTLEHTYGCKFFTGASHGVVSLNGSVNHESLKLLAEKCVAGNPSVRAVINNVHVLGAERELQDQPFLQPTIGEVIYFLDGISGVVRQVIINPNNRRVIAMIVSASFADQQQELKALNNGESRSPERLVVLPVHLIRYLTKVSGFLRIKSSEWKRFMDFDSAAFRTPNVEWTPPYPYCPADVLFSAEKRPVEYQILEQVHRSPFVVAWVEQPLSDELLANDSLGG